MKKTWRKINPPSDSLIKHYENLFNRNQMKFMRRSKLETNHLGAEFTYSNTPFKLLGTIDAYEMVIESQLDGACYVVHCDEVTNMVLGN